MLTHELNRALQEESRAQLANAINAYVDNMHEEVVASVIGDYPRSIQHFWKGNFTYDSLIGLCNTMGATFDKEVTYLLRTRTDQERQVIRTLAQQRLNRLVQDIWGPLIAAERLGDDASLEAQMAFFVLAPSQYHHVKSLLIQRYGEAAYDKALTSAKVTLQFRRDDVQSCWAAYDLLRKGNVTQFDHQALRQQLAAPFIPKPLFAGDVPNWHHLGLENIRAEVNFMVDKLQCIDEMVAGEPTIDAQAMSVITSSIRRRHMSRYVHNVLTTTGSLWTRVPAFEVVYASMTAEEQADMRITLMCQAADYIYHRVIESLPDSNDVETCDQATLLRLMQQAFKDETALTYLVELLNAQEAMVLELDAASRD